MSPPDEGSFETAILNRASGEKHPLQIWTSLSPGDIVSLSGPEQKLVGTVETGTNDGLIIWVRNDLNERKMFHFAFRNQPRATRI